MINNKRGQVTVFVIIGILIVAGVVLFFTLKEDTSGSSTEQVPAEVEPVKSYVQDCLERTGKSAIYSIGQNGGHYILKKNFVETGIPYYIKEGKDYSPTRDRIEEELSKYLEESLGFCTSNFSGLESFDIEEEKIDVSSEIKEDRVVFDVNYPLEIRKGPSNYSMSDFGETINVRLGKIYDTAMTIKNYNKKGSFCLSCLSELQEKEKSFKVRVRSEEGYLVYSIVDPYSKTQLGNKLEPESYEFRFAVQIK